jgi:asparagine synthase (glutamine-hydrolysing)
MHFTEPTGETLYNDFDSFLRAQFEPVPSTSMYAQYKVMELAKDKVVVTLDGQGADEQLAGYHYFFGFYFKYLLMNCMFNKLFNETFHYIKLHRSTYGLQMFLYFMLHNRLKSMIAFNKRNYISKSFFNENRNLSSIPSNLYSSTSLKNGLLDHFEYKLEHLLKWEDRNSMWFSLEARVPFLDHRLVEKTLALSPDMIINKGRTKYILRQALNNILPEIIRNRKDKIGFVTSEDEWFRLPPLKDFISDILHSTSFQQRGYIDHQKAIKIYGKHLDGSVNASQEIWKWINLELWFQMFENNSRYVLDHK